MKLEVLITRTDSEPDYNVYVTMQFQKNGEKWIQDGRGYGFKGYS